MLYWHFLGYHFELSEVEREKGNAAGQNKRKGDSVLESQLYGGAMEVQEEDSAGEDPLHPQKMFQLDREDERDKILTLKDDQLKMAEEGSMAWRYYESKKLLQEFKSGEEKRAKKTNPQSSQVAIMEPLLTI